MPGLALALGLPMVVLAQPAAPESRPYFQQRTPSAEPLTLDMALALSAGHNASLAAAAKEVDALQGGVTQAGLLPNPDLSIRLEDTRRETRTTIAEFGIPVELGGKRTARITAAERARSVAQADLAVARANVRAATVAAFFNVLVAQENVRLTQGAVDVAARAVDVVGRRVAAGKVPPLEETRAQVERANADLALAEAKTALESARVSLGALWGAPPSDVSEVVGNLDALPERAAIQTLLAELDDAPELVVGRMEIQRREAVVQLERSRQYPDIRITAGTQRDYSLGRNQALIGVSIPLPLFNRNQGGLYEATVRADQAEDQLRATRIRLDEELRQAAARLAFAREAAATLRSSVLPGAQQAYGVATAGFEAGKFGFLDILDAQRTLFQARIRYLASLADTYQAAIAIDRILGR
ncbi:TolC family protein [Pigmentiphaga soli]|uniref:TolC family protein n=1 Tax=Pigmentiphaga soli TaxID=1007095 RepID=A0ABP8GBA0_9BURK